MVNRSNPAIFRSGAGGSPRHSEAGNRSRRRRRTRASPAAGTIGAFCVLFSGMLVAQPSAPFNRDNQPADSVMLTSDSALYELADQLEVWLPDSPVEPAELFAGSAQADFQPFVAGEMPLPVAAEYWGRVQLSNRSAAAEWVLSFSSLLTEVTVYLADGARPRIQKTGTFVPLGERDFTPIGDQNLVKIVIPPGESRLLYYRAVSTIEEEQVIPSPRLQSMAAFSQKLETRKWGSGLFVGFMLMILVYSLLLYVFQRDRAYLYYSVYLFALIVWLSFNRGELAGLPGLGFVDRHPEYGYFFKLATYVGLAGYLAFLAAFLDLKTLLPGWRWVFRFLIWLAVPLLLIDAGILWSSNFSLSRADKLSVLYIVAFVIVTYSFLWPLYKTRDKRGIFIILGMLAMGGGFLMTAIHRFSGAGFTLRYFQIGTFIEVTIFSLGLAYRSNQVQRERHQATFELEKNRIQKEKQEVEARQLRELNDLKTQFYTNVTHEFRTPLTVILGMTEQLSDATATPLDRKKLSQGLELIQRNSGQLLRLINQLLNFAKVNSESMTLELIQGDIVRYLQYLTESFYSMAEGKQVRLVFYSEERTLWMDYDEEKIQQIVYNLLSNALKFTPPQGKVVLHVLQVERAGAPWLQLKVKDSGIGIAPEQLPRIFDPFYQGDRSATRRGEGTGIGLALTKELAELMEGRIEVESTPEQGSIFQILLPIRRNADRVSEAPLFNPPPAAPEPVNGSESAPAAPATGFPELPLLLLIEDNRDLVTYIQTLVGSQYAVRVANDGQAGIDLALELVPDIIICDVMMPEKDGFEVCATLKSDERTSHIPIVLLTARATPTDRLEGLQRGADAYLTKPFRKKELQIRLEKLVELRQNLRRRYSEGPVAVLPADPADSKTDPERQFLQKLTQVVLDHLSDADFGVPRLADAVLMSQTQVYRKLKALTDQTPSQFIRSLRLRQGLHLLQTTELTISEIAYDVGFSDPNYFSRTFHQEFKRPPSEFRK